MRQLKDRVVDLPTSDHAGSTTLITTGRNFPDQTTADGFVRAIDLGGSLTDKIEVFQVVTHSELSATFNDSPSPTRKPRRPSVEEATYTSEVRSYRVRPKDYTRDTAIGIVLVLLMVKQSRSDATDLEIYNSSIADTTTSEVFR